MAKVITDEQGRVILSNNKALMVQGTSPDPEIIIPKYTGHVDTEGLTALGWDSDDIAWLQAHVWWDEEDDGYWAVTEANLAFGPNGATPLTWANRASIKTNSDVRYFPKFDPSPSSNTSWANLFNSFINLCAIPTHGWDTSFVTGLTSAFQYCYSLRSVGDLSSWNIERVTSLNNVFSGCSHLLDTGDLSSWNTSAVTTMSGMFNNCYSLLNIGELSNWNTSESTSFASIFGYCGRLINIGDLSRWDTSKATSLAGMFQSCCNIISLGDLSNWDTSEVTTTASMFNACFNLKYIGDLSEWNTSKVTTIAQMFASCYVLSSIGDLSRWDVSKVTSFDSAFMYCYLLTTVGDLSQWDTSSATLMNYLFGDCRSLSKIDVNDWDITNVTKITRAFWRCLGLTELDLTNWDTSAITDIGTGASTTLFSECRGLTTIKLGPKFFNFTPAKIYINQCNCWTRDSIYESLYTNQTLRNTSSPAKTVALSTNAYDSLSVQDIEDIATKNITLTRE